MRPWSSCAGLSCRRRGGTAACETGWTRLSARGRACRRRLGCKLDARAPRAPARLPRASSAVEAATRELRGRRRGCHRELRGRVAERVRPPQRPRVAAAHLLPRQGHRGHLVSETPLLRTCRHTGVVGYGNESYFGGARARHLVPAVQRELRSGGADRQRASSASGPMGRASSSGDPTTHASSAARGSAGRPVHELCSELCGHG